MQKFIEVTGKNEDEALQRGLAQLGLERDDVSLEILERGRTGFLGIGSVPAKVRLTYEAPDPTPEPAPMESAPVVDSEPVPAPEPAPVVDSEPVRTPEPEPEPAPEKRSAQPKKSAAPETDPAEAIRAFQTGLFQRMGVDAVPKIIFNGEAYEVTIQGEYLGALIGHRGETLDAVQQLTGYAVNRGRQKRIRVHVDAENYRAKREAALGRLAQKMAARATRAHRSVALEPMNAYERHVIHAALQDYPGVSTRSSGVDPNRRVVIYCEET